MDQLKTLLDNWVLLAQGLVRGIGALANGELVSINSRIANEMLG